MRVLVCDICQSAMKGNEQPFAFAVGTNHSAFVKKRSQWSTGQAEDRVENPFMSKPFEFVKSWELCASCGVQLMQVLERASVLGKDELLEFKKLMS